MNQLDCALKLASQGFHVFPLAPNTKDKPLIKGYPTDASTDSSTIKKWWDETPTANIAISTSKFKEDEALFVIDVDNKGDKDGDSELIKLELEGYEFPPTFEQTTPTGGRHLVYRVPKPLKQGVNVLAPGLDTRSKGGYIVAVGSSIDGKFYRAANKDVAPAPEWVEEKIKVATKEVTPKEVLPVDEELAAERVIYYLENEAPLAVEGDGGDATTFKVAAKCKDLGVNAATCLNLLMSHWNERNSPPWIMNDLMIKVNNAYRYGEKPQGADAPEAHFEPLPNSKELNYLQKLNEKYAIVFDDNGHSIMFETIDAKGRPKRNFYSEQSFKMQLAPYPVEFNGKKVNQAVMWLNWKGRREYAGLYFSPEREVKNGYLNTWTGFTCQPIPPEKATARQRKGLDMFLEHAKMNICGGVQEHFEWVMGYFAHMIQKPYERPLTTVVFKGSKGVGKNALVDRVGNLLGSKHYLVAHDGRYLTSNFNGHMDSCLCLVLDEAFWSGDKAAEGKLKGLTTAPEIMIERKGKEPYMVDNLVRLVVIGNEDWLVPASTDERRYAVFNVGEGRKQDNKFFSDMRKIIDDEGGAGLLLHYFKTFDLSKVDVNTAPKTEALLDQKISSLTPFEQFVFDCLGKGVIPNVGCEEPWPTEVNKELFRNAFYQFTGEYNMDKRYRMKDGVIGRKLKMMIPTSASLRKRDGEKRNQFYKFPPLDQARLDWEKYIGSPIDWSSL